ncbi:pyridoxine 5'-phosphate synthase [Stella humosa]|uniref:pyridoxine 5'-phosphate synthase n=1 Tax=Stella humosa TaxID=94 RepID=UPI001B881A85|nr:pyridoxine 5'-phosphate synthase [Stella humosa]
MTTKPKLSVNINKFATLRNSRGHDNPNVLQAALDAIGFGAHGITVHPRPDERHIRRTDVYDIARALKDHPEIEFNIEGYPSEDFLAMVCEVAPHQCTLVPDPPEALTSNAGWQVAPNRTLLGETTARLRAAKVRVAVFIDPNATAPDELRILKELGVDRIELYTESYAHAFGTPRQQAALEPYLAVAGWAGEHGLGLNAGHDLNLDNLTFLLRAIPAIAEVSIGHALVCDALRVGYQESVRQYLARL